MHESIDNCRQEIDSLDKEILVLLGKRFNTALHIGEIKRKIGAQVLDSAREAALLEERAGFADRQGIDPEFSTRLFTLIMEQSRKLQAELD